MSRTAPMHDSAAAPSAAPGVSDARFARLTRGINASHWFSQSSRYDREHFETYNTRDDIRLIRAAGFQHVRFAINPTILLNESDPSSLDAEHLSAVDAAIDMILEQDLAVIVDPHPEDDFKHRLNASDELLAAFAAFWQALARHLSRRDPEHVFLEVLNEPVITDRRRWATIQETLLAAMRAGAPEHTLIATGHRWSSIDELLEVEPIADRNVVYNFHCYDPHDFTHQGATWGSDYWPYLEYLPYPSSPDALAPIAEHIMNERAKQAALRYGEDRWDAARLDAWIARAAAWGKQHSVRLTCNEFGVYRRKSRPEHRLAWLRDLRSALERYDIGWTMWDYAGGFSVVTSDGDRRVLDGDTAAALGLATQRLA